MIPNTVEYMDKFQNKRRIYNYPVLIPYQYTGYSTWLLSHACSFACIQSYGYQMSISSFQDGRQFIISKHFPTAARSELI